MYNCRITSRSASHSSDVWAISFLDAVWRAAHFDFCCSSLVVDVRGVITGKDDTSLTDMLCDR